MKEISFEEDLPIEDISYDRLVVYVVGERLKIELSEIEARLGKNIEKVKRLLYGMKFLQGVKNFREHGVTVGEFVQYQPTTIYKEYYYVDINNKCRLYFDTNDGNTSVFMVCERVQPNINQLINLIKII